MTFVCVGVPGRRSGIPNARLDESLAASIVASAPRPSGQTASQSCSVSAAPPVSILMAILPEGTLGAVYNAAVQATTGTPSPGCRGRATRAHSPPRPGERPRQYEELNNINSSCRSSLDFRQYCNWGMQGTAFESIVSIPPPLVSTSSSEIVSCEKGQHLCTFLLATRRTFDFPVPALV